MITVLRAISPAAAYFIQNVVASYETRCATIQESSQLLNVATRPEADVDPARKRVLQLDRPFRAVQLSSYVEYRHLRYHP